MISPEYAQLMARYSCWMNARLFGVCDRIPDSERRRDRGAFFRSIHGTLNHLLVGDRIWMGRLQGPAFAVRELDIELYADFEELATERAREDGRIVEWAAQLDTNALSQDLLFRSVVHDREHRMAAWIATTHFFNHQTHHRGQLSTLISQCGEEPGVSDLMWLPGLVYDA